MCPARRRARRTASALLEVAMQSSFQEKCSYTMAVWGLLDGGSVTVRPTVTTTAAPPAVVPPVADPSVYIVTWAFVSRINCKLRFAVIVC